MAAIPQELMEDIFSRLPVKSLLRFEMVSKKLYSLISDNHEFAKLNLKQTSASSNLVFFQNHGDGDIFQYSDIDSYESRRIKFPIEIVRQCRVIGSANGLICVAPRYHWDCFYIWNPCTGECRRISQSFPAAYSLFGFGYDSVSDDYKIIGVWDSHFRVFSLKTNSWRILEYSSDFKPAFSALHSKGVLYWSVGPRIAAFDLAKETIWFLNAPGGCNFVGSYECSWVPLFEYRGLLCASGRKSIWVAKQYDDSKYWVKFTTSLPEEYAKPVCISRVGEVVFQAKDGRFVKLGVKGRMSDEDKSRMMHYGDTFSFKESLISPNCV